MRKSDLQPRKVRADLDGVTLALVDLQEVEPYVRLRIKQAIIRAGLGDLLEPALADLDRMVRAMDEAMAQVRTARSRLEE